MRFGFLLVVALLMSTLGGFAEPWKSSGSQWALKGVSIAQPSAVKVKAETDGKDNSLKFTGTSDDFLMGFFLLDSKAAAEKVVDAMRGAMKGLTWKKQETVKTAKFDMVLQEGENNGKPKGHFTVGYLVKGKQYLVFLASYPAENKKLYDATVATLSSATFK